MISFTLQRDARRRLVYTTLDGRPFFDVEPVRAFPLSDPRHSISICDAQGREILYIESLDDLDAPTRAALEGELAQREFVPVILRVINMPTQSEPATWHVETDRGLTTFEVDSDDCIYRRPPHRVSIVDSRGIRYEIPDTQALDHHSRRVLDRFL